MSAFPYMKLYTRDFRADTEHLNAQATGAYALLLMWAWELPDCKLPDDDKRLAKWARVPPPVWRRIKPDVMAFWILADGMWGQKRLTKERAQVQKRVSANQANGLLGGRPKSSKTAKTGNPLGSNRVSQKQPGGYITRTIEKEREGFSSFGSGAKVRYGAGGATRDTSKTFAEYKADMIAEGKYRE